MQKIFKIERVDKLPEFKTEIKTEYKKKRKARNNKRFKSQVETKQLQSLIAKQAKLHNEEKELLEKQVQMYTTPDTGVPSDDVNEDNLQLLRSESVVSYEQETRDTSIVVTSIDAAILEGLDFIKNAPIIRQRHCNIEVQHRLPARTEATPEYTLVLDLDETLVHCSISPFEGYDEVREWIYISYRPYLIEFLEKVSQHFEVVVFTASEKEYATMVLDRIDPEQKYIHHRLFRDSCLPLNGNYIKDLTVLGRDIDKTIIIDNSIIAFSLNLDNGIPIHSFSGDKRDTELYKLAEIVGYAISLLCQTSENLSATEPGEGCLNLREYLTSMFGLKERINFWQAQYLEHVRKNISIYI